MKHEKTKSVLVNEEEEEEILCHFKPETMFVKLPSVTIKFAFRLLYGYVRKVIKIKRC